MVITSRFKSNCKISTSFFFFLHNVTDSKLILSSYLTSLNIWFPPFFIKSPFHIKEALYSFSLTHCIVNIISLGFGMWFWTQESHEHKHYNIATVDLATEMPTQWVMVPNSAWIQQTMGWFTQQSGHSRMVRWFIMLLRTVCSFILMSYFWNIST